MAATKKKESTLLHDATVLFLITLIAGVALGFVYELTKTPIREAKAKEKRDSYTMVFEKAYSFTDDGKKYMDVEKGSNELLLNEAGIKGVTINEVLEACSKEGTLLGYVMTVTSHEGYGGDVPISIGITLEGEITGLEVLGNSETSGFGSKASKPDFKKQFTGIKAEKVQAGEDFDGISGATYTTNAITNAVNGALYYAANCTKN